MIQFTSPYRTIEYFEEDSLVLSTWNKNTFDLNDSAFKNEFSQYMSHVVEKYKPQLYFYDSTNFRFPIIPELQVWIDNEINKSPVIFKKIALVVSKDFFAQVSIEQTMEANKLIRIPTKYFDNKEEALKWLRA